MRTLKGLEKLQPFCVGEWMIWIGNMSVPVYGKEAWPLSDHKDRGLFKYGENKQDS